MYINEIFRISNIEYEFTLSICSCFFSIYSEQYFYQLPSCLEIFRAASKINLSAVCIPCKMTATPCQILAALRIMSAKTHLMFVKDYTPIPLYLKKLRTLGTKK